MLESIEERPGSDPRQVEQAWVAEANLRYQAYLRGEEQAAKLGANGIILQQFSDQTVNVPITTYNGTQTTTTNTTGFLKKGSGLAIFVEQ